MERSFEYSCITLNDIACNSNLIFICDGDNEKVIVESENLNKEEL